NPFPGRAAFLFTHRFYEGRKLFLPFLFVLLLFSKRDLADQQVQQRICQQVAKKAVADEFLPPDDTKYPDSL
ncbi:hypothetical protein, partial [Neglectibacter timonensis]|uniref:hypothetical protein n=1 Tax=Neglectibacter timonensis TaxID=1776382 RepID=UPI00248E2F6E